MCKCSVSQVVSHTLAEWYKHEEKVLAIVFIIFRLKPDCWKGTRGAIPKQGVSMLTLVQLPVLMWDCHVETHLSTVDPTNLLLQLWEQPCVFCGYTVLNFIKENAAERHRWCMWDWTIPARCRKALPPSSPLQNQRHTHKAYIIMANPQLLIISQGTLPEPQGLERSLAGSTPIPTQLS